MFSIQEHSEKVLSAWKPIREKMYWVIVKITNDKNLAEDVLQEALITAINKFQTLKDESKFEPWFLTISIRKAYELLGSRNIFIQHNNIEDDISVQEDDYQMPDINNSIQYKEMVHFIINHLQPETKKHLFYLRYIDDKSLDDIIKITGIKEGTLKSIYHRMRRELALVLTKEFDLNV